MDGPGRGVGRIVSAPDSERDAGPESWRRQLLDLLRRRSVRYGDFVLASGERSSYYIDGRLTTMSGEGQWLIGRLGLATLRDAGWSPRAVGGLTLGADPVAYAMAHAAADGGAALDAFTVRKQPKDHGTGRRIEGPLEPGSDVVVVEDVVTTGSSALRAVEAVQAEGCRVVGVLCVVDRGQGGRERIAGAGLELRALVDAAELIEQSRAP